MVSRLKRAMFVTGTVMVWERLLPAVTPFLLWAMAVVVAGQWGLWARLSFVGHVVIMGGGLLLALGVSVRFWCRFRRPRFTETNQRLAGDNRLRPERLLAMRHEKQQPRLKTGRRKAGIAEGDPLALRYLMLMVFLFGFWVLGPVPLSQIVSGFLLFDKAPEEIRF